MINPVIQTEEQFQTTKCQETEKTLPNQQAQTSQIGPSHHKSIGGSVWNKGTAVQKHFYPAARSQKENSFPALFNIIKLMNKLILSLIVLSVATAIELKVDPKIILSNYYQLDCLGASGHVSYQASNLPVGVSLVGDRIEIVDQDLARNGYYPVKIKATDPVLNESDERILVIVIRKETTTTQTQTQMPQIQVSGQTEIRSSTQTTQISTSSSQGIAANLEPEAKVHSVLDSYSVPTGQTGNFIYPDSGYPTLDLPTEGDPDAFNPQLGKIISYQATRSEANRNQITEEDVKTNSVFERQLNAARALANLLDIVRQATANRNVAKEQIVRRESLLTAATEKQRTSREVVAKAEEDVTRLKTGIQSITQNINQIRTEINQLQALKKQRELEKQSVIQGISTAQKQFNDLTTRINSDEGRLNDTTTVFDAKNIECSGLEQQIALADNQLNQAVIDQKQVVVDLADAKTEVQIQADIVSDLQNQLAIAQAKLQTDRQKVTSLEQKQNQLNNLINTLRERIVDLEARVEDCIEELAGIQERIDDLNTNVVPDLVGQRAMVETEINRLNDKLTAINLELEEIPNRVMKLEGDFQKMSDDLAYLRNQLPVYQGVLNDAYYAANEAAESVRVAKQNLEAANKRYLDESNLVKETTHNIELARIEKNQADLAVENLLMEGANILPFAAAPNPEGYEVTAEGTLSISSWKQYVSDFYGRTVKPYFTGDLQTLYSFRLGGADASNLRSDSDCQVNDQRSLSGFVIAVNDGSFRMLVDGEVYTVQYGSCTQSLASVENYSLIPGDVAVVKGVMHSDQNVFASNMACVRQ